MVPVDTGRQTHAAVPGLGELVVHIAVIGQFRPRRRVVGKQIHTVGERILQLGYRSRIAHSVLNKVNAFFDSAYPVFVQDGKCHILESKDQGILDLLSAVQIALDLVIIALELVHIKTGHTPFDQILRTHAFRRSCQVVRRHIETRAELVRDTFVRIVIIEEGVDIEIMLLASHVRQRRRMDRILGAAPDEEIAVLVAHIIHIETHRHIFACRHGFMVGQVASQTHAVIKRLLTVTLVLEAADGT